MRNGASGIALLLLPALFILATVGVPVKKEWDLFSVRLQQEAAQQLQQHGVRAQGGSTIAQVGVLGVCYHFDPSTEKNCTQPALGYPFPALPGITIDDPNRYRTLTKALILNPLTGAIAGASALIWLVGWALEFRILLIIALIPVILTFFAGLAAFGVNLAIILVLRSRIWDLSNHSLSAHMGYLFWFSVGGCGAATAAFLMAVQGTRGDGIKGQGTY